MKEENHTLKNYLLFVEETDRLPVNDLSAVLHGLFGEVGGIMTAAKKLKREPDSFTGFDSVVVEEFGDTFWYLCCLANRLSVDMEHIFRKLTQEKNSKTDIFLGAGKSTLSVSYQLELTEDFDAVLVKLGRLTGDFLSSEYVQKSPDNKIYSFLRAYFDTVTLLKIDFSTVISANKQKVSSRFLRPNNSDLPTFDNSYPEFERLPDKFEIEFIKRTKNQQAMRLNGVFIGSPLTDSISEDDGYRFHDVFHFSYAAILHWSPTFRALIKHKRKSNPKIDEAQDGGRAIVVEEGLSAWIFTIAKENQFFQNRNSLTFDMLKNIGQIVKGFEVEECPLILWEEAILTGFEIFREVVKYKGGSVIGDRSSRTIIYKRS